MATRANFARPPKGQMNSGQRHIIGQNARMNEIFSPPGEDEEGRGPLMRGLACLPVFFSLAGKRVVLAGGSNAVLWKAELCQAAGARLDVFSPDPCSGLVALARRCPAIALVSHRIEPEDFHGAALAIVLARLVLSGILLLQHRELARVSGSFHFDKFVQKEAQQLPIFVDRRVFGFPVKK